MTDTNDDQPPRPDLPPLYILLAFVLMLIMVIGRYLQDRY